MRLGLCTVTLAGPADPVGRRFLPMARRLGYDYIELPLAQLMDLPDREFDEVRETLETLGLPCEAVNNFVPGSIPITGPDVDQETIRAYVRRALDRACRLGVRRVVVGSSGARNVPEGFDRSRAWDQLREFLRLAGGEAAERNVLLAIEPINHGESNIINTTGEGRRLMEAADSPCTGMLVDYFHYVVEKDTPGEIWQLKGKLWHAHISQPKGRVLPTRQEAEEYREFFRALKKIGYEDRLSVEGYSAFPERDAEEALAAMRMLAAE